MFDSSRPHGLYIPWNSLGQNTGVGSLSLLQGILPIQGLNPGLPHCRQILYQLSHKGSLRILEWVAYSFSSRSSRNRNQTRVSYIAGRFFTNWALREALELTSSHENTKITINCWTTIDKKDWNLPKEIFHIQRQDSKTINDGRKSAFVIQSNPNRLGG